MKTDKQNKPKDSNFILLDKALETQATILTKQVWVIIQRLNGTYDSRIGQYEDMISVGKLGEALKSLSKLYVGKEIVRDEEEKLKNAVPV